MGVAAPWLLILAAATTTTATATIAAVAAVAAVAVENRIPEMLLHALPDAPSRSPLFSNDLPLYLYHVEGVCRVYVEGVCWVYVGRILGRMWGVYGVFRGVFGIYMVYLHV